MLESILDPTVASAFAGGGLIAWAVGWVRKNAKVSVSGSFTVKVGDKSKKESAEIEKTDQYDAQSE